MNIISENKINFNSLEEKTFKEMMKLGRTIIQDELREIDKVILKYRDKDIFVPKDMQTTTIKTKLGEIPIVRRRYKAKIDGKIEYVYLLDEFLKINSVGLYSEGLVEMITREVTSKSYRKTAQTITEDADSPISYTAVRNIVIKLGERIKSIEKEKIKLYEEGRIEGNKESEYIFCEHDGIYVKKQKSEKKRGITKTKRKNNKKKKSKNKKKKRNGIELKIAVIHEGKKPRYTDDYKLKSKIIVGTASSANKLKEIEDTTIGTTYKEEKIKNIIINGDGADWTGSIVNGTKEIFQLDMAHIQKKIYDAVKDKEYYKKMHDIVYTKDAKDILNIIYNYKVELDADGKTEELEKVKELEEYLRNNKEAIERYQYKLGYTEEEIKEHTEDLPTLGSEESHMYCVCRARMKKNRTSWSREGAEAILKVIMNKMNGTLREVISKEAEENIRKELSERIPDPKKVKKTKQGHIAYAGKYEIANNFTEKDKQYIIDLLRDKKATELMLIN